MAPLDSDTIAAIATAPGRGGVGIIRVSGPLAPSVGRQIAQQELIPRHAHLSGLHNASAQPIDEGLVLLFPGPHSFTGEDIVEFQAHGGPVILDMLLQRCCELGARPARPGEFSERAFLNGKIDLSQAEAIADLINSTTEQAALNAGASLQGVFSERVNALVASVTELRVYVEAAIDFPEEEIDFIKEGAVSERLEGIMARLESVYEEARQGALFQEGMKLVIAGAPNAGKSSLLNALAGQDTAIVTPIQGTTRDVLREHIQIDGMPLHIVDTAGLRDSNDPIEQEGIRRAREEMTSADRILLVIDDTISTNDITIDKLLIDSERTLLNDIPVTVVRNKCDLSGVTPGLKAEDDSDVIYLSAATGAGLIDLKQHLLVSMGYKQNTEGKFSARRRHWQALEKARECLEEGRLQLTGTGAGELLAEDLRRCQNHLGTITGTVSSDDLLGEIFSSFCIGK
ncbi:MAG: tRNA uridine-5-carboxymethylaminomethyl(34) synthesis GTPase MnmE [Halieaceae bacterium]